MAQLSANSASLAGTNYNPEWSPPLVVNGQVKQQSPQGYPIAGGGTYQPQVLGSQTQSGGNFIGPTLPPGTNQPTGNGSPIANNNGTLSTAPSQPSAEDQARNQYFSFLDQQSGMLPETQKTLESQVNGLFSGSQSSINTALQGSLGDLNLSGQKIDTNKATSLRDLGQELTSQLSAGARYLGSIPGAANSTASGMYNFALGKVGNKARADVMKQTNELHANLDNQIAKVKATAQDQLAQLDTWKNTQLTQIAQYIQQQRGQIDQAKAAYIQSRLQNIDAQANSYKQSLVQWAMNNSTTLDGLKQKLSAFSQGNPTDITNPGINGAIAFNGPQASNGGVDQYGNLVKKKENTPGQPQQYLA